MLLKYITETKEEHTPKPSTGVIKRYKTDNTSFPDRHGTGVRKHTVSLQKRHGLGEVRLGCSMVELPRLQHGRKVCDVSHTNNNAYPIKQTICGTLVHLHSSVEIGALADTS